jgi:hypothetical protein
MYIFSETKVVDSQIAPGVQFVFRNMTEDRRLELQKAIIEPNRQIRDILAKIDEIQTSTTSKNVVEIMRLNDVMQTIITQDLNPAKIRWGMSGIRGLFLGTEENPATMDNIMRWPSPILEEALNIIDEGTQLSEPARKNSESSSTSGAVAETTQNSTIAPAAEEANGS